MKGTVDYCHSFIHWHWILHGFTIWFYSTQIKTFSNKKWKFSETFKSVIRLWASFHPINRLKSVHLTQESSLAFAYLPTSLLHSLYTFCKWLPVLCNTWDAFVRHLQAQSYLCALRLLFSGKIRYLIALIRLKS